MTKQLDIMIAEYLQNITFTQPLFFILLALIPVFIIYYWKMNRRSLVDVKMSEIKGVKDVARSPRVTLMPTLLVLRILAFAAIVTALARPQTSFSNEKVSTEGIDIMLALDISTSMWAIDFQPNRMEAAKKTAIEFVKNRPYDRMGLVVFAGEAFTQCPITLDHDLLEKLIDEADNWQIDDGTALGDGLWLAVGRLADSTSLQSKVLILLTDGVQTAGEFAPLDAALAAQDLGMRIYTIGIGSKTNNEVPAVDPKTGRTMFKLRPEESLDEETLKKIAAETGGKYFRAASETQLSEIYSEIDKMEKAKIETNVTKREEERFYPFALLAVIFLFLEIALRNTIFRTVT